MRSLSTLATSLSAIASLSAGSAHTSINRPGPIAPVMRASDLDACLGHALKDRDHTRSFRVAEMRLDVGGSSWIGARSPGTALISACSTLVRSLAARPSVQLAGMCMCTSTKRRWPARA